MNDSAGVLSWSVSVIVMVGADVGEVVGSFVGAGVMATPWSPPPDASLSEGSLPWEKDWLRRLLVALADFMDMV